MAVKAVVPSSVRRTDTMFGRPRTAGLMAITLTLVVVLTFLAIPGTSEEGQVQTIETRVSEDPMWADAGRIEWRKDLSGSNWGYTSATSVADVNNDGYLEVLVVSNSYGEGYDNRERYSTSLNIIDNNGNVIDSYSPESTHLRTTIPPIVCDLDADGQLEILIGGSGESADPWDWSWESTLLCLDSDLNLLWTFNASESWTNHCPAVGDLNNDGMLEIIYAASQEVICIDHKGDMLWGMESDQFWDFGYSPSIEDLDRDGWLEVILVTWDGVLVLDGDPSDGYDDGVPDSDHDHLKPYKRTDFDLLWYFQESIFGKWWWGDASAIADVRGDGKLEIITGTENGVLACLDAYGNMIWNSEIEGVASTPVIGDVDNDGRDDILTLTYDWNWWDDWGWEEDGTLTTRDNNTNGDDDDKDEDPDRDEPYWEDYYHIVCMDGEEGDIKWMLPIDWWGSNIILCDLDMDRDLEAITTSADQILCIDCDEDGDGDISEDEILWEFSSDSYYGWYNSFVVADIDLDNQMELVTVSEDMVYSLSAGGISSTGGIEWGKLFYDLYNTNHYIHPMQSGVYVYPKDSASSDESIMVSYASAGEVIQYDMTVLNAGKYQTYYGQTDAEFSDTFVLYADNVPEGWSAVLSKQQVTLGPRETEDITLQVQVPYGAASEEAAKITVVAQAKLQPRINDTQDTVTIVKGRYNVKLSCADNVHGDGVPSDDGELIGGDSTVFRVTVTNLGRENDTIILTTDAPYGFNVSLTVPVIEGEARLPLGAGEARDVLMIVDIPTWATGGDYIINITGTSEGDPDVSDTLSTTTRVMGAFANIVLRCDDPVKDIEPGQTLVYNLTVLNFLGDELEVEINLTSPDLEYGWEASLSANPVTVAGFDATELTLMITAPDDALADTLAVFDLSASVEGNIMLRDQLRVYARVIHVYGLDTQLSQDIASLVPEGVVHLTLEVENTGNGFDHWGLFYEDIPGEWTIERDSNPMTLDPRNKTTQTILFNITVPRSAVVGTYDISLLVTSEGGRHYWHNTTVEVLQYYGLELAVEPIYQTTSAGRILLVELNISNTGNGPDGVGLSAEQTLPGSTMELMFDGSLEQFETLNGFDPIEMAGNDESTEWADWSMIYAERQFTVQPFSHQVIKTAIIVPSTAYLGTYEFTITARSAGLTNLTALNKTVVEVTAPDLTVITNGAQLKDLGQGDVGVLNVDVANLGNAPAYNVTVSLYLNDEEVPADSETFGVVKTNETVVLKWVVRGDEDNVRIVVDPEDDISEVDETNNEKEVKVELAGSSANVGQAADLTLWIALIIAALLIIAVIAYIIMMKRSQSMKPASIKPETSEQDDAAEQVRGGGARASGGRWGVDGGEGGDSSEESEDKPKKAKGSKKSKGKGKSKPTKDNK